MACQRRDLEPVGDLPVKIFVLGSSLFLFALAALAWSVPARAGQVSAACSVVDVASFNNRVHIHCTKAAQACDFLPKGCQQQASAPPPYVAVESNSAMAATVVQIGLAALANKQLVEIFYDDDAGANPAGCNTNDCRRLIGVVAH